MIAVQVPLSLSFMLKILSKMFSSSDLPTAVLFFVALYSASQLALSSPISKLIPAEVVAGTGLAKKERGMMQKKFLITNLS